MSLPGHGGRWTGLGVIPARGGSKGVPGKNNRPLGGRPLIAYTIDAARHSRLLSHFLVSTDSPEIARVAVAHGAPVIERPSALATDEAPMVGVVRHALEEMERRLDCRFDWVATLQPTTPFRAASDIDAAVELLRETGADSVLGVVRLYDAHPVRVKRIVGGRLHPYAFDEDEASRRQDLPPAYIRNGAIYLTRRDVVDRGSLRGEEQVPFEMPAERSVNIDEPIDFLLAEAVLQTASART